MLPLNVILQLAINREMYKKVRWAFLVLIKLVFPLEGLYLAPGVYFRKEKHKT